MSVESPSARVTAHRRVLDRLDRAPEPAAGVRTGLAPMTVFVLGGIALWLSLIALNNATDFDTNRTLIGDTISMKAIVADHAAGQGLAWRAWSSGAAGPLFAAIIAYQVLTAGFLWRAVVTGIRAVRTPGADLTPFVRRTNQALMMFAGLFLFFLIGGLWFAYWLHLGPAQQVHFTLLIIGALLAILVNLIPIVEAVLERSRTTGS